MLRLQIQLMWISSACLERNCFVPVGSYSMVIMQGHNTRHLEFLWSPAGAEIQKTRVVKMITWIYLSVFIYFFSEIDE